MLHELWEWGVGWPAAAGPFVIGLGELMQDSMEVDPPVESHPEPPEPKLDS